MEATNAKNIIFTTMIRAVKVFYEFTLVYTSSLLFTTQTYTFDIALSSVNLHNLLQVTQCSGHA